MTNAQRRNGHMSQVRRIMAQVEEELQFNPLRYDNLFSFRDEISRQKTIILNYTETIQEEIKIDDFEQEVKNSSDFLILMDATSRKISSALTLNSVKTENTPRDSVPVRLPNIKLMRFTGDSLHWQKFWDLFKSSIHERSDLSGSAKFHYLVTQLSGEAEQLLTGFDHTDAEYEEAVNLLRDTYGKPQRLIQARIHALFDLKSPEANAADLGKFRSQYEGHLRGLKSLGADVEHAGYVFAELLIRKLPTRIKDNLNRAQKSDFWNLSDLRKEIDIEIGHLQSVEPVKSEEVYVTPTAVFKTTTTGSTSNTGSGNFKCRFCFGEHIASNCTKYVSINAKRARVNELKLCFNCLRGKHIANNCNNEGRCRNCNSRHHTSICNGFKSGRNNNSVDGQVSTMTALNSNGINSILPTANLSLMKGAGTRVNVKALLDSGSQRTFILKSLVNSLELPVVGKIKLSVDGFFTVGELKEYELAEFCIKTSDGAMNITAVVVDRLPSRILMNGRSEIVRLLKSKGIKLADSTEGDKLTDLGILIGIEYFFQLLGASQLTNNVFGVESKVGTIIGGTIESNSISCNQITVLKVGMSECDSLDDKVRRLWESFDDVEHEENNDVLSRFNDTISYENGKYSVGLPWKHNHPPLPENYYYAKSRLNSNLSKLRKEPGKLGHYDTVINDQLRAGFIEEVTNVNSVSDRTHYIAHSGVVKDSATTPLRVVFDCSAKIKGKPSLNDCLYSGPNLINDLIQILIRLRCGKFAATSDIKKAFLNVRLHEVDRDSTRFFWPRDPFVENSPLLIYRFTSVLFGSTASPFLLNATLKFHLESYDSHGSEEILKNTYVDNIYLTSNSESNLETKKEKCFDMLKSAGFSLHKWYSNSTSVSDNSVDENLPCNVLGIKWDTKSDTLAVSPVQVEVTVKNMTKREVVSMVASTYDPMGVLAPITVTGRLIIQDVWKTKIDWDNCVSDDIQQNINNFCFNLSNSIHFKIPRCAISEDYCELHIFSDASTRAYGSVVYIKSSSEVNFLLSKFKLAPLTERTLPELELSAILLSTELANYVVNSLKSKVSVSKCIVWSDSSIALHWLQSNKIKRQFVSNKVAKIRRISQVSTFKHIRSSDNPADLLTRGLTASVFLSRRALWLKGPEWLESGLLPDVPLEVSCNSCWCEFCDDSESVNTVGCSVKTAENEVKFDLINRYSNFKKLVRVTAYVRRFVTNCRKSREQRINGSNLIVQEYLDSEHFLVGYVQRENFSEIFRYFEGPKAVKPDLVRNLKLFIEGGVLRCGGRIHNSNVDSNSKFPLLLPRKSHFTNILIRYIHEKSHFGINYTIAAMRQNYWISRARQTVKSVIRGCLSCKRLHGRSYSRPETPPLPSFRVTDSRPFSATCVDYTGALTVKDRDAFIKYYICLFTCAVTRAVHLEIVEDLSAESFIRALQRFSARRSYPSIILSDNATNFCASNQILTDVFQSHNVSSYQGEHCIQWKFITPAAPWMGGVYERLIGVFKSCFKKLVSKAILTYHEMRTIIPQIEAIMNDRPLTYASEDLHELEPLTPSMLLYGYRILNVPIYLDMDELEDPTFNTKRVVTKRFMHISKLFSEFKTRWTKEYLLALRERDRSRKNCTNNEIKLGSLVLIHDENDRILWKLGLIVKLHVGIDGIVRSVDVKTRNGILCRPIVKLYPMEIDVEQPVSEICRENETNYRSSRRAAREARDKIKDCLS